MSGTGEQTLGDVKKTEAASPAAKAFTSRRLCTGVRNGRRSSGSTKSRSCGVRTPVMSRRCSPSVLVQLGQRLPRSVLETWTVCNGSNELNRNRK